MDPEKDFQKDKMLGGDRKKYRSSHTEDLTQCHGKPCFQVVDALRTRSLMFKRSTTDILSRSVMAHYVSLRSE